MDSWIPAGVYPVEERGRNDAKDASLTCHPGENRGPAICSRVSSLFKLWSDIPVTALLEKCGGRNVRQGIFEKNKG